MSSQSRKARTAYFNRMQCDQIKSRKQNPANDERKNSRESDSDNTTDRRGVSKFLSRHLYNATIMVAGNGAAKSRSTFLIMFHSLMLISPSIRPLPSTSRQIASRRRRWHAVNVFAFHLLACWPMLSAKLQGYERNETVAQPSRGRSQAAE